MTQVAVNEALARDRGIDLDDPKLALRVAAERLSTVRYVFLVQIEDGIATAAQRASLEYADAVLIGWPENDAPDVVDLDEQQQAQVAEHMRVMEDHIRKYAAMERDWDIDGMTDTLIRITERVAEIRRVVQQEWDEDMGKIDPKEPDPTAEQIEEQTEDADKQQRQIAEHAERAEHADRSGQLEQPGQQHAGHHGEHHGDKA